MEELNRIINLILEKLFSFYSDIVLFFEKLINNLSVFFDRLTNNLSVFFDRLTNNLSVFFDRLTNNLSVSEFLKSLSDNFLENLNELNLDFFISLGSIPIIIIFSLFITLLILFIIILLKNFDKRNYNSYKFIIDKNNSDEIETHNIDEIETHNIDETETQLETTPLSREKHLETEMKLLEIQHQFLKGNISVDTYKSETIKIGKIIL